MQDDQEPKLDQAPQTAANKERLWTFIFIAVVACSFFNFLVGQGLNAGTTVYLDSMGMPLTLAGLGALCFSVAAAVVRILSGSIIDSRGRMIVVYFGSALLLIGCAGPLIANDGALFVFWRLLQGVGFSAATTALSTAAPDIVPAARLGEGISYYGLGQALAMTVGPAIAIMLATSSEPQNLYIGVSCFAALALGISIFVRYEKDPSRLPGTSSYRTRFEAGRVGKKALEQTEKREEKNLGILGRILDQIFEPGAVPASLVALFMCGIIGFSIIYAGAFGTSIGVTNPGLYFTCTAVVMIVVRLAFGRMMNSGSPFLIMIISVAGGTVTCSLFLICSLGLVQGAMVDILFYTAGLFYGVCLGLSLPINVTVAVKMSPDTRWGAANALMLMSIDVGIGIFSYIWGAVIDSLGFTIAILAATILMLLALVVAYIVYPKPESE